jgi:proline iminopeptidase
VIGSARYYPRVFSQTLREHLRLVFLDHRGFAAAPSPIDPTSFELETLIDDIERARQELGLERVAVMGHSGHAYMALEYGKKYSANVSHVVMIGIAPDLSAASQEAAERYWQESVSPDRKAVFQANLQRLPDAELAKRPLSERFIQTYIRNGPKIWFDPKFDSTPLWEGVELNEVVERVWGEVFPKIDLTQGLDTFDRPVFLSLGRYDFLVAPPSSWDPLRPHFRNLTVRVFERSGHTPQYEEAALFDAELLGWMKKYR